MEGYFIAQKGYSVRCIGERLLEEGLAISRTAVYKLIKKENLTGQIADKKRPAPKHMFSEEQYN